MDIPVKKKTMDSEFFLPQEIMTEILLKLPIKSLFRCKVVCKTWLTEISDPRFQARIHNIVITSDSMYVEQVPIIANKSRAVFLTYGTITEPDRYIDYNKLPKELMFLNKPSRFWLNGFNSVSGPCNGVFLFHDFYGGLVLWNHATRDYIILSKGYQFSLDNVSLGEVLLEDGVVDFVVLRLYQNRLERPPELYRLTTNKWEVLKPNFPVFANCSIKLWNSIVCVNGVFYWFAYDRPPMHLVSFDSSSKTFSLINDIPKDLRYGATLMCYTCGNHKFLSIKNFDAKKYDIWVMRECGSERSWVMESSMKLDNLLTERSSEKWKIGDAGNRDQWCNAFLYEESLVPLRR